MTVKEAIKTIDENIPEPWNKMVDGERLKIAIAWQTAKMALTQGEAGKIISAPEIPDYPRKSTD